MAMISSGDSRDQRRTLRSVGRFLALLVLLPAPGLAAGPVAMVESVSGAPPGIETFDYLSSGDVVQLGVGDKLVIDYLQSCVREIIGGRGSVSIGADRSAIRGSTVERERVRCDGGRMQLSPEQSAKSAGTVFRVPPKSHPLPPGTVIERQLYGTSPIIDVGAAKRIVIERLDAPEDRIELSFGPDALFRGRFVDFAASHRALSAGGIYRATAGDRSLVFQVDRSAKPGNTPVAARLLRF